VILDLVVLTGFLGSGKTTLLRDYLALPEAADTAVIVNEAGEIGMDGAILAEGAGGLRMAMLANGCVCCAAGSELAGTIESLLASTKAPPSRIVLETSGVSKPGPILRSLQSLAGLRLRIGVLATFDCLRGTAVAGFEEAAAQWAGAQALILTRRDLATPAQMAAAAAAAAAINPTAEIIDEPDRRAALRAAFAPRPPAPVAPPPQIQAHPRISTFLARPAAPLDWDDLAAWLDNLAGLLGERLLRVKGLVAIDGAPGPVLIQSVGTLFSAPRPFPPQQGPPFLVIIARDTAIGELDALVPPLPLRLTAPSPFSRRPEAVHRNKGKFFASFL
jgi:G3E family GTPase